MQVMLSLHNIQSNKDALHSIHYLLDKSAQTAGAALSLLPQFPIQFLDPVSKKLL